MRKKKIEITEQDLDNIVKDVITEFVHQDQIDEGRQFINEMAKLNVKDGCQSPFPANAFTIVVQGDNSLNKPPHVHVSNTQENYNIRVYIENGKLMSVASYGKRKRTDDFSDVLKALEKWFEMPSTLFQGTNRYVAMTLWYASNPI